MIKHLFFLTTGSIPKCFINLNFESKGFCQYGADIIHLLAKGISMNWFTFSED